MRIVALHMTAMGTKLCPGGPGRNRQKATVKEMLRKPRYVIAVHDLAGTARFYRDALGFSVHEIADPGWLFLVRDECFIMAGRCSESLSARDLGDHSYFAYVEVDDIGELYSEVKAYGVDIVKPLTTEPWGMVEFGLRTPEGHRLMFASPVATS